MESPRFEGFHAQLDCKLTNGNKNKTQLTRIVFKVRVQEQNRTKQNKTGVIKNIAKVAEQL